MTDTKTNTKKNPRTSESKAAFKAAIQKLGPDKDGAFRATNRLDGKKL